MAAHREVQAIARFRGREEIPQRPVRRPGQGGMRGAQPFSRKPFSEFDHTLLYLFFQGSHWPIYRTREDSGAMDLEGVLERPNKAAGVNALRVWRFCKAIKCEDLKEEGESPSPLS